jgi:pyruvate formate-lyase activating enzyme-like uncharacterized protein
MNSRKAYKVKMIELNRREYGPSYDLFKWLDERDAGKASRERDEILASLPGDVQFKFCDTKLHSGDLSPGCLLCGQGAWSCLFINSTCNASCFYCPTEQVAKSEPMTNGIPFSSPQDYVDYIDRFNISGVGISGGEPFLTFDRTMVFVTKIKKKFGSKVYLWLYTNGIAATEEKLKLLGDAGLDEIRFDITSTKYSTDKVQLATGIVNTVTVEIPAIPEDIYLLKRTLSKLKDIGVKFLNLHHLRSTPHNCKKLIERDYTFLHGPQVTVLESELTALRLMKYAGENDIGLPINYCSFVFKNQFQTMGHRKRIAPFLCETYENLTPVGIIRRSAIKGKPEELQTMIQAFRNRRGQQNSWHLSDSKDTLFVSQSLLPFMDFSKRSLFLSYYVPILTPKVTYRNVFKEVNLNHKRKVLIERVAVLKEKELIGDSIQEFRGLLMGEGVQDWEGLREVSGLEEVMEMEAVRPGLQEYY